jgi:ABC-type transport system involved in cytochrome bd biosynthesis fused ATPase/permease subunit
VGTGAALGGGTLALSAWSPLAAVLVGGVLLVLALTVAVVVLTAARGRDHRQQRNSAAVLDRLLRGRTGQPGRGVGRQV